MIAEARKALGTVRGEGLMALQAAMAKHEADLRGLYTTLGDQVRQEFLGVRAELDATQAGLRQIGVAAAAASSAQAALQYAGSPAAPGPVGSSPAAPSPSTTSPDPLRRFDPWAGFMPGPGPAVARASCPAMRPEAAPQTVPACDPVWTTS